MEDKKEKKPTTKITVKETPQIEETKSNTLKIVLIILGILLVLCVCSVISFMCVFSVVYKEGNEFDISPLVTESPFIFEDEMITTPSTMED